MYSMDNLYNDEKMKEPQEPEIIKNMKKLIELGISNLEIITKYEKRIIELHDPSLSYYFAKDIKGADILAHEKVVIDSKDLACNYYFAKNVNGIEVLAHENVIKNAKINFAYNFIDEALDEMTKEKLK